jgi:hypothetical protein
MALWCSAWHCRGMPSRNHKLEAGTSGVFHTSEIFDAAAMRHPALRDARRGGVHATCLVSFPSRTREESTTIRLVHGRAVGINADQ